MSVIDTLLGDIEQAVRGTGDRRRHALLRRTTATLIDHLSELSDHHLSIFDNVLLSLTVDVDPETRAELSEKLADLHRAPKKTLHALATDDSVRVAKPVIERSPCLDDDTVMAIIRKGDEKFLSLVAKRRALSAHVLDHLVEHADEHLLIDLARNVSTPISDRALRLLAERALSHPPLYRILRTRPDLTMRHIGAIIEAARYRARADAIARDTNDDMLSRALAVETAKKIATTTDLSLSTHSSNADLSHLDADLNTLLERDQMDDAFTILAARSGVTADTVKRAFHAPQHEPLLFLLRAQDYPLATVMSFMRQKHGVMSEEFESQVSNAYCALARDTAKRIAAFMAEKHHSGSDGFDLAEPLRRSA